MNEYTYTTLALVVEPVDLLIMAAEFLPVVGAGPDGVWTALGVAAEMTHAPQAAEIAASNMLYAALGVFADPAVSLEAAIRQLEGMAPR